MTRILADLPEEDVKWLDRIAAEQGKSRAAILREAVANFRDDALAQGIEKYFGLWSGRADIGDAVAWQQRERAAWSHAGSHAGADELGEDAGRKRP